MSSNNVQQILADVLQNISQARVDEQPFDHLYVEEVFPEYFYREIIERLPLLDCYTPIGETGRVSPDAYPARHILDLVPENIPRLPAKDQQFWAQLIPLFTTQSLTMRLAEIFKSTISNRFQDERIKLNARAILIRDLENYSIGPHSDSTYRLISALFYLPRDDSLMEHGTSLYEPKEPGFTCQGGPHYRFEDFRRVKTVPFAPNSMIAFPPTDKSFHGVEPVNTPDVERNLLLLNIGWTKA